MKTTTRTPVSYLHYYGKLHGTTVTKDTLQTELTALQHAINTRVIRKTTPHVKLIANIQRQYITLINSASNNFKITIKDPNIYNVDGLGFAPVVAYVARKAGKAVAVYAAKKVAEKVKNKITGKGVSGTDAPKKFPIKIGKISKPLISNDVVPSGNVYLEKGNSYQGFEHIIARHSVELNNLNLTAEMFAKWVLENFTHIYIQQQKGKTGYLFVFDIGKPKLLVCKLEVKRGKNYYSIITEGFKSKNALSKEKLLWSRAATSNALNGLGVVFSKICSEKCPNHKLPSGNTTKAINSKVQKNVTLGALGAKLLKSKFYAPYKTNAKGTLVSNLPLKASGEQSGVYQIKEVATGNIVYVGFSANNLYRTILRHFQQWTDKSRAEKTRFTYAKTGYTVRVLLCNPERAAQLEKALIQKYNPRDNATKYNNYLTDKQETAAVALYQHTYTEEDKEWLQETDTNDLFGVQAKKPTKALNGVMNATDMANFSYTKIGFDGEYKRIFGNPANNFDMCINGEPGAGKTVFLLKLANYMANNFGNVLYVTTEEYGSATLKDKTQRFKINSPNLYFAKTADKKELSKYPIVFLDSVNHSKLTLDEYKQLREENPQQIFVLVLQNTKKGTFKGANDWPHEVEIVCNLYKDKETGERILNFSKDRYNDTRQITLK
jgi:hypothetical protein